MADEEMALPNSSGDDYDEDPQEKKAAQGKDAPKEPAKPKKARYTLFDFLLMLAFATLIVAMMYLKYHEEMFAKEQYKFESTVRVRFRPAILSVGRQLLQGTGGRAGRIHG